MKTDLQEQATIQSWAIQMQNLIAEGEYERVRLLARKEPNVGKALFLRLERQQKTTPVIDPDGRIPQIMEALLGMKEGGLAKSKEDQAKVIKRNIAPDMAMRNDFNYRKGLGGAWLLWELSAPWNMSYWARGWVCPPVGPAPKEPPVPELAFGPKAKHRFIRCEFHGMPRDYNPQS